MATPTPVLPWLHPLGITQSGKINPFNYQPYYWETEAPSPLIAAPEYLWSFYLEASLNGREKGLKWAPHRLPWLSYDSIDALPGISRLVLELVVETPSPPDQLWLSAASGTPYRDSQLHPLVLLPFWRELSGEPINSRGRYSVPLIYIATSTIERAIGKWWKQMSTLCIAMQRLTPLWFPALSPHLTSNVSRWWFLLICKVQHGVCVLLSDSVIS